MLYNDMSTEQDQRNCFGTIAAIITVEIIPWTPSVDVHLLPNNGTLFTYTDILVKRVITT